MLNDRFALLLRNLQNEIVILKFSGSTINVKVNEYVIGD